MLGIESFFIFLYGVPEQPAPACRWLDIWHKAKSHIWLFHVASVVMVKQQDGDKKGLLLAWSHGVAQHGATHIFIVPVNRGPFLTSPLAPRG
jgi:hypothetical protein